MQKLSIHNKYANCAISMMNATKAGNTNPSSSAAAPLLSLKIFMIFMGEPIGCGR